MALLAVLAWTTFAFGGVYPSTLAVPALLVLGLVVAYRPRLRQAPHTALDTSLLVALVAAVLQTIPLPRTVLAFLSPEAARVAAAFSLRDPVGPLPLTIDLTDSAAAVALFGGALAAFFTAREIFAAGGVRTIARGTAVVGLLLAGVAIAQDATGGGLMYWRWRPTFERTYPFGPFVNRNHFGTWAIMAIPLAIGYLTAHATAHRHTAPVSSWRTRLIGALDGRAALLLASAALMIVAVVLSLSRSALVGLAAALLTGGWLAHRRAADDGSSRRPALIVVGVAMLAGTLIIIRVPPTQIMDRVSGVPVGLEDRASIWRETMPVIRDFWLVGTGTGTFQDVMAVYQRSDRGLIYNQAHNHYLQVAAEGGLLVGIPVAMALFGLGRDTARAIARDASGMFWLRAGAAAGLAGVAVQSVFETGLLTPANGLLAGIVAAVALHVPGRYGPPRAR